MEIKKRGLSISENEYIAPELYDDSAGYDDETGIKFASGLTDEEREQATLLYRIFNGLWGVCIVVGDPGLGKDLFSNVITYKIKSYFPWKRIMRDERPRRLYGKYAGIFDEQVLASDLSKMREISKGGGIAEYGAKLEKAVDDWMTDKGQVMLKNSVLYLTEFWRYCYNREPNNPMNKTMGGIHKEKRHLDCLIIGTVQLETELDKKTCLPWVDWKVTCTRSVNNRMGFVYFIQKVKYDRRRDILETLGRPFPMAYDGGTPRSCLGNGVIVERKPQYEAEDEDERNVLEVSRAAKDKYEDIRACVVEN